MAVRSFTSALQSLRICAPYGRADPQRRRGRALSPALEVGLAALDEGGQALLGVLGGAHELRAAARWAEAYAQGLVSPAEDPREGPAAFVDRRQPGRQRWWTRSACRAPLGGARGGR